MTRHGGQATGVRRMTKQEARVHLGNREPARWSLFQLDDPQGPPCTARLSFGLFLFFLDFAIRSFYTSFFTTDHAA